MNPNPQLHPIGSVAGKHGFKGAVQLNLDSIAYKKYLKKGTYLFLNLEGKGVPFLLEEILFDQCVKFQHVDTEQKAEEILGLSIGVVAKSKKLQEGFAQLIGFEILDAKRKKLGKIQKIETYPAGEMLFIQSADTEWMLPLVEDWILGVDPDKANITMQLPEGLMGINLVQTVNDED